MERLQTLQSTRLSPCGTKTVFSCFCCSWVASAHFLFLLLLSMESSSAAAGAEGATLAAAGPGTAGARALALAWAMNPARAICGIASPCPFTSAWCCRRLINGFCESCRRPKIISRVDRVSAKRQQTLSSKIFTLNGLNGHSPSGKIVGILPLCRFCTAFLFWVWAAWAATFSTSVSGG